MRLKILQSLLFFLYMSLSAQSQDTMGGKKISKWNIGLEGMIGVSAGKNFYSLNAGGPSFFLVLNNNWKVGVGALPSIYLLNGKLGARLGVSPRLDYKNISFIAPFFHRDTTGEWIWSVGFGYKFHKK